MHQNVKVAIRVRPFLQSQEGSISAFNIHSDTLLLNRENPQFYRKNYSCVKDWSHFDRVMSQYNDNEGVYGQTVAQMIDGLYEGISCSVMMYGQTGSGKTFTMTGGRIYNNLQKDYIQKGILHYSIQQIISKKPQNYSLIVSYFQIYSDNVYDLLSQDYLPLQILQSNKEFYIKDITKAQILTLQDALHILEIGHLKRKYASTVMNHASSRSHCILRIQLTGYQSQTLIQSEITFVDLAGSQRLNLSKGQGRQSQSKLINKSLFFLTQVIAQLSQRRSSQQMISYRNSPLTKLLKNSLGGNSKSWIVICLNPSFEQLQHSLSSLRLGVSAKNIILRPEPKRLLIGSQQILLKKINSLQQQKQRLLENHRLQLQQLKKDIPIESECKSKHAIIKLKKQNILLQRKVQIFQQLFSKKKENDDRFLRLILGKQYYIQNLNENDLNLYQQIGKKLIERVRLTRIYNNIASKEDSSSKHLQRLKQQISSTQVILKTDQNEQINK